MPRCCLDGHNLGYEVGKAGLPSLEEHDEHEEHGHEEDECKDQNLLLQKLRFHAMTSKTWTWVPILEDPMKTNTKA